MEGKEGHQQVQQALNTLWVSFWALWVRVRVRVSLTLTLTLTLSFWAL
jgi:hypothetical protein